MKYKVLSLLSLLLASCAGAQITPADPNPTPHDIKQTGGVFSKDGNILDSFKGFGASSPQATLGANQYIWRAALQSISFMPLTQADSAGGVILSDWMSQQDDPRKQVKVNIYMLGKQLNANSLDVKVFSRQLQANGTYSVQVIDKATSEALEDTILSQARSLKIADQSN